VNRKTAVLDTITTILDPLFRGPVLERGEDMDDDVRLALQRLDHIEQYLVRVGQKNGPQYKPTPGFVPAAPDVVELARAGKTDDAISRYQELTGADVDRATAVVDATLI